MSDAPYGNKGVCPTSTVRPAVLNDTQPVRPDRDETRLAQARDRTQCANGQLTLSTRKRIEAATLLGRTRVPHIKGGSGGATAR